MAPYARREVTLILLIGGAATAASGYFLGLWALLPAVATLGLLAFYRDPRRQPPAGENLILAPADGKVVEVTRDAEGPDGRRVLRIMIFLSVFDVHINRSPCAGRVLAVDYRRGKFRSALRAEANRCNESNTVTIDPVGPLPGPVQIRQIAGVLARRIVCPVRPGDHLTAGQRVGMIKLGSRTEVCLVEDPRWEVLAAVGDRARAGRTVLARLRTQGEA
jgi:phosphatidylserine decarboxylase